MEDQEFDELVGTDVGDVDHPEKLSFRQAVAVCKEFRLEGEDKARFWAAFFDSHEGLTFMSMVPICH